MENWDDRIARYVELRAAPAGIGGDARRAAEHRQRKSAFRLLLVIALIGVQRMSALVEGGLVAGAHDPVAQRERPQLQRPQQRIGLPCWRGGWIFLLHIRAAYAGPRALRMASTHCFKGGVGSTLYFQLVSSTVSEPS